jgi:serine/threonine protein kinase/Tfp pilus assembly protein PilF
MTYSLGKNGRIGKFCATVISVQLFRFDGGDRGMNSLSPTLAIRQPNHGFDDAVGAFRMALDLFDDPDLAEFAPPTDHPKHREILCELVRLEMAHRWKSGQPTSLEYYQERCPELFADAVLVLRIAQDEFKLRQNAGEKPTMAEYRQRFHLFDEDMPTLPGKAAPGNEDDPHLALSQTRPGLGERKASSRVQSSEPEIDWKLNEAMFEMPKVGDEFLGFQLLAELGKGAFGRVFVAQQGQLAGRLVALKVATGLFGESQTLAQLQHSHIMPIYSYHHGQPFQAVCMPFLGSTTLADVLSDIRRHKSMPCSGKNILSTLNDRRKRSTRRFEDSSHASSDGRMQDSLPIDPAALIGPIVSPAHPVPSPLLELEGLSYVDSILWMAVRLTDGLAHAHERGILHRDLKPANVLITDDGVPMLLDFNLAADTKTCDTATSAAIGGTLPYMSPEHLEAFRGNAQHVDARSDIYSLGVILFELLTGAAPYPSYRKLPMREVVQRMIIDRRRMSLRMRDLNGLISPAVESILKRCLAADPKQRYQSARELQEDLQCQLDHKPLLHAPNISMRERCRKFRQRHPRLTSMTSVGVLATVLIAALAGAFAVREDQRANLEARQTLSRFEKDANEAYFLLNPRNARKQVEEGEKTVRTTLAHFQVLEEPKRWRETSRVSRLPAPEQERVQSEVGQLLVLLAHARQLAGEAEPDPKRRSEIYQEGAQFCALAVECYASDQAPQALWKQQGELLNRLNDRALAEQAYERARQTELRTAQDRYLTARQLAEEGKFRDALPLVKEAIRLNPQDYNMNFLQGICHDYLGQPDKAIECYRTCIALRPRFHGAYYNRGLSYMRQKNFQAAREDFDQVLRMYGDFQNTHVNRALAFQGLKMYREAESDLTAALEQGHSHTRIYFLRAKMRELLGDKEGSASDFAEGLRLEPRDDLSWTARGYAQMAANPQQALEDFDKALDMNPRSLPALQNKAHVLGKYLKRTEDAISTLDTALQLYPDDAALHAGRGVYLARLGKRTEAVRDAEQALLLDTSPPNLYQVAGIYALTSAKEPNDRQESLRLLSQALKSGFGYDYLEIDRDLDRIRDSAAFRNIVSFRRALQIPANSKK